MKIAIDCRMLGSGGIGTYLASMLPYFLEKNECLLFGDKAAILKIVKNTREDETARGAENEDKIVPDKKTAANAKIVAHAEIAPCNVKPFSLKELFAFPRELLKKINSCDVYYTPYCNIPGGVTIPIFSTIHDVVFLDVPGLASKAGVFARKWFYKRAVRCSRALFTVSEFSAERIRAQLGCKKLPIIVTYNALPPWFSSKRSQDVHKIAQILFVGNIKKHKGLRVLLDAYKKAREKGLSAPLVIVGNADNFRTGDTALADYAASIPGIRFTGKISDVELRSLYENSTLLVQPSLYEGFGIPPLEALSLGTHALISDIPVFKEIYADFPVTFFKSGDADDLAQKLLECANDVSPVPPLPQKYSYKKSAEIILLALEHQTFRE